MFNRSYTRDGLRVLLSTVSVAVLGSALPLSAHAAEAAPPLQRAAADADLSADEAGLEAITVTARHRTEKLQEVPIAVTAITSRQLETSGNFNLRQIQAQVPSLNILGFNPRNVTIQIRGLGTTAGTVNSGIEPGVGVYVNGVYYARPSVAVFDLFDVASVNVLRGPQGTLFGKNTVAGVIDISTNPASYEPEIQGEISYGNYNYSQIKLAASTPIGASGFAVRIAAIKSDRDGTIYNTTYRDSWQDYHNRGVRGELAYRNTDESFTARLIGDYNDQQHYSGFQVTRGVLPKLRADGSTGTTRDFYDRAAAVGYTPLPIDPSARLTDLDTPFTVNMQTGGASLQLDKSLLGDHKLTSITAWRFWDWDPSLDGDRTGAAVTIQSNLPTKQRQFSQELRIASPSGGRIEYTAGLYYFWQKTTEVPYNTYGKDAAKWLLGAAFPDEALANYTNSGRYVGTLKSYSGFVNSTWHVTDKFDLTGGIRYTYEERNGSYSTFPITTNATPLTDPIFASLTPAQRTAIQNRRDTFSPTTAFEASTSGGRISGTINGLYRITPNVNVYAGYSRGFKSAGINMSQPVQLQNGPAPTTFAPETVDAFEIGLKTDLFANRLTFNLALFRSEDSGYQANQSILVDTSTGPIARQYLTNAGDVRTQGVEVDIRARPVEGLSLTAGATYDDAKFRNYTGGQCPYLEGTVANAGVCDLSGRQLTGVSKFVYNVSANYEFPVGDFAGFDTLGYLGGDYSHRSSFSGALNTDPYARIPAYGLANIYVGLREASGKWDLKFWVRNLFDKLYFTNASVDTATTYTYGVSLGDPRFIGGTLSWKL
ncbi:MAG: TonB-dependent receptor [Sphingobium sp.]